MSDQARPPEPPSEGTPPGISPGAAPHDGGPGAPQPTVTRPTRTVTRRRRRIDRSIRLLVVADLVLVFALAAALGVALVGWLPTAGHPAQSVPTPQPSASAGLMTMGLAHIPTNSPCILCHEGGGTAALKVIPAITHPLEGWRQCLSCHTRETLDLEAPGHEGIAETECLNCHKEAVAGPAITQPHAQLQDQHCLDCHGSVSHLPSSMATMKESECTWCHKPTSLPPPEYPHAAGVTDCRSCHKSPEVGNLPVDHALYPDSSCLLCHLIRQSGTSPSPAASTLPTPSIPTPAPSTPTPAPSNPSPTQGG